MSRHREQLVSRLQWPFVRRVLPIPLGNSESFSEGGRRIRLQDGRLQRRGANRFLLHPGELGRWGEVQRRESLFTRGQAEPERRDGGKGDESFDRRETSLRCGIREEQTLEEGVRDERGDPLGRHRGQP